MNTSTHTYLPSMHWRLAAYEPPPIDMLVLISRNGSMSTDRFRRDSGWEFSGAAADEPELCWCEIEKPDVEMLTRWAEARRERDEERERQAAEKRALKNEQQRARHAAKRAQGRV